MHAPKPLFMSAEHIALMNGLLEQSEAVKAECRKLPRDLAVAFVLSDGPRGHDVFWNMECSRDGGVTMELGAPTRAADVTVRSDYRSMILASQGARSDGSTVNQMQVEGDSSVVAQFVHVLAVARSAAVVDVEFPQG